MDGRRTASFLAAGLLCLSLSAGAGEAWSAALFKEAAGATNAFEAAQQADAARSRRVTVDFSALTGSDAKSGAASVDLNLFADTQVTAVKKQFDHTDAKHFVWIGSVPEDPTSSVILVSGDGLMAGTIQFNKRLFEIVSKDSGEQAVIELDHLKRPPDGCDDIPAGSFPFAAPTADQPQADSAATYEVLVVYTPSAQTAAGGATSMSNKITLAMTETNQGYANSGVTTRARLAHKAMTSYTESASFNTDLSALVSKVDGKMDEVHALRTRHKADVVELVINNSSSCGLANAIMAANADAAFCVVHVNNCMTGYYSFGHEIGHLQGARHDWSADPTNNSPFDYNHGDYNTTLGLRTVMAYNNAACPGGYCDRVLYWSTPYVNYPSSSTPTGSDSAPKKNNALCLNTTDTTVSNFVNSAWRAGESDFGSGWKWLSWFGIYNINSYPWVYHQEHGWLYAFETASTDVTFWDIAMAKFLWTSPTVYPFMYRHGGTPTWLWYEVGSVSPRSFFNYALSAWENWY